MTAFARMTTIAEEHGNTSTIQSDVIGRAFVDLCSPTQCNSFCVEPNARLQSECIMLKECKLPFPDTGCLDQELDIYRRA